MKQEFICLEEDFANNSYYGTNVWTEEKYRVLSGNTPVLVSAPHSVNQIRDEDEKNAEKYTGAIARYLNKSSGCYSIFQLFTHADPNNDEEHNYKNAVINIIEVYNIKLLLDIHSSDFKDDTDIDIVTNNKTTLCGFKELIDKLNLLGIKYNIKFDENNKPNLNSNWEIISNTSLLCGIPSIRLVINNNSLNINNFNKIERICNLLTEFIMYFDCVK